MDEGVRDLVCLRHLAAMDKGCSGCSCAARAPSRTETLSPAAESTLANSHQLSPSLRLSLPSAERDVLPRSTKGVKEFHTG